MRSNAVVPLFAATLFAITVAACASEAPEGPRDDETVPAAPSLLDELESPAAPGSRTPSLFAAGDGTVYMSWQEPLDVDGEAPASTQQGRFALRFARLEGNAWGPARTITEGDDFFVNWADFPTIAESDGTLAAHWLRRNGGRGTAYDIHVVRSTDGGETWSESVVPHHDGTQTEHGFVSLVADPGGGFTAIWLDGRKFATAADDAGREMTLRATRFDSEGAQGDVELLDGRICDCCQTSAAYVGDTLVAVYRDRSAEEIRDIWSVRRNPQGWQEPVPVADDGWQIPGCPVNGPAIAAHGDAAAVAWFTMRQGMPEVKVAFADDGGATFGEPVLVDSGAAVEVDSADPRQVAGLADASDSARPVPLGRVDVAWADPTHVVVSWIVARGADAEVVVRTVAIDGKLGPKHVVAATGSMRASGFPRTVRQGDRLVLAWTDPGGGGSLRTGSLSIAALVGEDDVDR
jgi:hypothetical protein